MERESIETKDTWNLSSIYKDEQEFYDDLNEAKQLLDQLVLQKDLSLSDVEHFIHYHQDYIRMSRYIQKLHCF